MTFEMWPIGRREAGKAQTRKFRLVDTGWRDRYKMHATRLMGGRTKRYPYDVDFLHA